MISGARQGDITGLRRLFAKAMAKDLTVFVVPGLDIARVRGLDIEAAGLQVVASPRHASVLLILGDISPALCEAASIVYAQMMRPKILFAVGVENNKEALFPLPVADISVGLSQQNLVDGVNELRTAFETGAFQPEVVDYDAPVLQVRIEYVCPMHPEVVRDEPSSCPKCGMTLMPREAQTNTGQTHTHTAHEKMNSSTESTIPSSHGHAHHEQITHDSSAGVKEKPEHQEATPEYTCPMHPEIVQDAPGDCPKCGMHLEPREKVAEKKHEHLHHGSSAENDHHHGHQATAVEYTCSMHPEVVQEAPGDCPKCEMHLEPREKVAEKKHEHSHHGSSAENDHHHGHQATAMEYTCSMHPEVVQDAPGDCPKCGMHLEPREKVAEKKHEHSHHGSSAENDHHHGHQATVVEYTCPMHPEVVQDAPGDCPKCGMHLEPREKQSTPAHEHGGMNQGDHSQMNHDESGFMSMVEVTRDLPRSSDGLQMEWIDAPFGPFFPGLPSGLQLTFSLDGDTVAGSQVHSITENSALLEHSPMHAGCFVKHFLSLDPLTPVSSQLLVSQAMENAAGVEIDVTTAKARIGVLERERIASHLNWLVLFAQQTGFAWLARRAGFLQLAFLNADIKHIVSLKPEIQKLIKRIQKTPLLKPRTSGIGQLPGNHELCGVVARASGVNNDVRSHDAVYASLGFKAIEYKEGDAWARLHLRLDEMIQSLSLIEAADAIALPEMIKLDEVSGTGTSQIEAPRGKTRLQLSMSDGFVTSVQLETPSMHHLGLVETLTEQQELGDALVAVGSLDLSPWEIRQ